MTACFRTSLQVVRAQRKLDLATPEAGAWVLTRPLVYESDVLDAVLTVPQGFRTDFASVPRLPFIYLLYGGDFCDEAATVHDYLYSASGVPRATADAVFREALKAQGVAAWRRWPMWFGVRLFGGPHYAAR
jgi:hypothetical protein